MTEFKGTDKHILLRALANRTWAMSQQTPVNDSCAKGSDTAEIGYMWPTRFIPLQYLYSD